MIIAIAYKTFTGDFEDFQEIYRGRFRTKEQAEKFLEDKYDLYPEKAFPGEYTNSGDMIGKIEVK